MKQRCGKLVQDKNIAVVKELSDKYSFNFYEFMEQVKKAILDNDYNSFVVYIDSLCSRILKNNNIAYEDLERLRGLFDNCYIVLAAKHFILSVNDLKSIDEQSIEIDYDSLDRLSEIYIDFQDSQDFWPVCLKICKANYTITTRAHEDMTVYNVSLLLYNLKEEIIGTLYSFSFSEDLHSRFLVDKDSYICAGTCSRCTYVNEIQVNIKEHIAVDTEFCLVTQKKLDKDKCLLLTGSISPQQVLHFIGYILKMYDNRQNLERKNGRYRDLYKKNKVHVAHTDLETNKESVLSFNQYYKYEQTKKPWQGGHHNSPIEHPRKSHKRVYRNPDGSIRKVTEVKATTVNKGGRKGVYKV